MTEIIDIKSELRNIVACPDCHAKVIWTEGSLYCSKCDRRFPLVGGIPVLFSKRSQLVELQGSLFYGGETVGDRLRKRMPSFLSRVPSTFIAPQKQELAYNRYVLGARDGALILNLGSGSEKTRTNKQANSNGTIINLDIFPHSQAHIVADGHYLPFLDGVFDGVYMLAVMEHVNDPFVVCGEVARVLKHGGFVLATAPFIYPMHSAPSDYFRFTDESLRRLFSGFRELECAAHGLPTRGLIEFLKAYAAAFSDNRYLAYALAYVVSYLLFPLKYLDKYLQRKERARNVCSSFYYVGIKETTGRSSIDASS